MKIGRIFFDSITLSNWRLSPNLELDEDASPARLLFDFFDLLSKLS